jgi:peptidoglycan L-alanyl-D-glutamate endopeptidase CwlK
MKNANKLKGVDPKLVEFVEKFDKIFPITVIFGVRTVAEQDALYAQGRTKPGKIVTNAKGGQSAHNFGLAVDIGPDPLDWSDEAAFDRMVEKAREMIIAFDLPIELGADFKNVDRPHFQIKDWKSKKP